MRILVLATAPQHSRANPSGMGRHLAGTVDAFRALGHDVEAVLGGELAGPAPPTGAEPSRARGLLRRAVPRLAWETARDVALARSQRAAERAAHARLAAAPVDLVYERIGWLHDVGRRLASERGVPLVAELNAPLSEERVELAGRSLLLAAGRRRLQASLEVATLVVVVSRAMAAHVERVHGVARERILVLPNAVTPMPVPPRPPGPPTVGMVGSFLAWHGTDLLVAAFARARRAVPEARLLLVGSGPALPAARAQAESLGIARAVEIVPRVPPAEVARWLARIDVGVMPRSNWYGSPVKIFEYGLHGIPVVSVDVDPVAEVVEHGVHGLLFPDGDLETFAAHLEALLSDEGERVRIGAAWRERVLARHTWTRNAERLFERLSGGEAAA